MNIDTVTRAVQVADGAGVNATVAIDKRGAQAAGGEAAKVASARAAQQQAALQQRVQSAAAQIESYLKSAGRALEFRVDTDTGRVVVTVRDAQTGETIRQIPSEEALDLARSLGQNDNAAALVKLTV